MKVLVCGSRGWGNREAIRRVVWERIPPYSTVIHGAASRKVEGEEQSADALAAEIAAEQGHAVIAFPADWDRYGKRAGILRNLQMLDEAPDLVIAFQRNGSRGTQHTIDEARKRGIPVEVHGAA